MTAQIVTPSELAAHLGISCRTLARWHVQRKGPPRVKVGKYVGYRASAIESWLVSNETLPVITGCARNGH